MEGRNGAKSLLCNSWQLPYIGVFKDPELFCERLENELRLDNIGCYTCSASEVLTAVVASMTKAYSTDLIMVILLRGLVYGRRSIVDSCLVSCSFKFHTV